MGPESFADYCRRRFRDHELVLICIILAVAVNAVAVVVVGTWAKDKRPCLSSEKR